MKKNSGIIFEIFVITMGTFIVGFIGTIISWFVAIKIASWDMCDLPEILFLFGFIFSLIIGIVIGKISCVFIKDMNLLKTFYQQ